MKTLLLHVNSVVFVALNLHFHLCDFVLFLVLEDMLSVTQKEAVLQIALSFKLEKEVKDWDIIKKLFIKNLLQIIM